MTPPPRTHLETLSRKRRAAPKFSCPLGGRTTYVVGLGVLMKHLLSALSLALLSGVAGAGAGAVIGQAAPVFSVQDVQGRSVSLADLKGKHVVLESACQ